MDNHVKIHFRLTQDEDGYPPVSVESVWAQPCEGKDEYVLDNVPFFVREATLGDVVAVQNEDGNIWFNRVIRRSENSLLRAVLFEESCLDRVTKHLESMGCSTEYDKAHKLLAINVPKIVNMRSVQSYLQSECDAGFMDYEEPILRQ